MNDEIEIAWGCFRVLFEILPGVLWAGIRVGDSILLYIIEEDSEESENTMKNFSPAI